MATGDKAAAAGLAVFLPTQDRRLGYDNDNVRGDELADHMTIGGHLANKIRSGPVGGSNVQADLDYLGGTAVPTAQGTADLALAQAVIRALNFGGDANAVRFAQGPTAGAYGRTVGPSNFQVWMDGGLEFGRNVSSIRYKDEVEDVDLDPVDVLALRPVTYHRKGQPDDAPREFGLIAEEVDQTLPQIVTWFGGQIDGVRYDLLSVALLSVVQAQQRDLADLRARIESLEG